MRRTDLLLTCFFLSCTLAACGKPPPAFPVLPEGEQTMTGTLLPTALSTLRRGTHILKAQEKTLAFVESSTVNLRTFEGKNVRLRGLLENNSDPTLLPVLVVREATAIEQETREVSLPTLGMRCTVPSAWNLTSDQKSTRFSLPNSSDTLLLIKQEKNGKLPADGVPFLVDGRQSVRIRDGKTLEETVTVLVGSTSVIFRWMPPATENDLLSAQWPNVLDSVRFTAAQSASSVLTGSGSGTPCGGTAGILCPKGEYCAITDMQNNIGRCRKGQ